MHLNSKTRNTAEITLNSFLQTVTGAASESLNAVIRDTDVEYLIILETASKDRRKIIPAGPSLDFRTPKDAAGKVIGNMRMSSYVDLVKARASSASEEQRIVRQKAETAISSVETKLKNRIKWIEKENYELENKVSNAKKQIVTRNQIIEELKKQVAALHDKITQMEQQTPVADASASRNDDLEAAEEELITRMNEYMEKEAELEQREENLFHRERRLHESENSKKQTA